MGSAGTWGTARPSTSTLCSDWARRPSTAGRSRPWPTPRAEVPPLTSEKPTLRTRPEDFRVDEVLAYTPIGEGGHTYIRLEKRLLETEDVAHALGRLTGVRPAEIGYAGRKDRAAIATQWFSVPGVDPARALAFEIDGCRVLEAVPHGHKLRVGRVRANRFDLIVRGVPSARLEGLEEQAETIRLRGIANRFGPQRFGRGGHNVQKAVALARGEWRERDRRKARFLHSALQAWVFNEVLDAREAPVNMLAFMAMAAVLCVLIGSYPVLLYDILPFDF